MSRKNKSPKVAVLLAHAPNSLSLPGYCGREKLGIDAVTISSSQHTDLLKPFIDAFSIRIDHDLRDEGWTVPERRSLSAIARLDRVLTEVRPDLLLVQGDTTTALAGAIAAFNLGIRLGTSRRPAFRRRKPVSRGNEPPLITLGRPALRGNNT